MDEADKKQIFTLLQSGRSNSEIEMCIRDRGGTKHDFKLDFATEKEAEQFARCV